MATCDVCGRKLAPLFGRAATKNHRRVAGLLDDLGRFQAAVVEQVKGAEDAADELERFRGNIDRLMHDGERYAAQLHEVSHDSGYPGVDYAGVRTWMDTAVQVLRSKGGLLP